MKNYALLLSVFIFQTAFAQTSKPVVAEPENDPYVPHKSIHQVQSEKYAQYNFSSDAQWDSLRSIEGMNTSKTMLRSPSACNLNKRVYGWHPYWSAGLEANYDWEGLSDLCYFSYEVNSANGNAITTHGWSTASVVTTAQANGVNVTLCATLFSGHTAFFGSTAAKQTLITNLINLVQARNAKGVNIDFEGMGASHKTAFTAFMIDLCNQMHAAIPGSEVSICLYAVDWSNVFDMPALNPYVDLFVIMGYDYYYSGSTTAGPESPLYNFQTTYNYTLAKSLTFYLKQGTTPSKLLLGLPWYGREWATSGSTIPSATTGGGTSSVTYTTMRNNSNGYYSNRQWDPISFSTWYPSVRAGVNWQAFIDDAYSMGKRFDLVNQRGVGGIGIWALGYDNGYNDFWDIIKNKFTDCATVPCTDTIYDMGGPARNYYDSENYTFTIAPSGATSVGLNFSSFATELNYDTLWIYDGGNTSTPLIGAYHGNMNPGSINSTGGSLTLRYKSDISTVAAGWQAIWNCTIDNIAPTTLVSTPSSWATSNFSANFTDTDNSGGSGIAKSYYQVLEYNGTEWRANNSRGFFSDNFDNAIHPDWSTMVGTWSIAGGYLNQSDETNSNTNIYAPLTQNLSNQYLYNWQGKITGTGTNRRAGFHFFCDDATQTNRGNSYFIWIRPDQSTLELYKVVNNVFSLASSVALTTTINTWNDYKIIYDRITGKMDVYVNNALTASWTDPSPLTTGNAISFRSGNCNYTVNDLKVYRSRLPSVTVTVGSAATNDVRYQNPDPSTPSCRVKSITRDAVGNLSTVAAQDVDVDWTIPSSAISSDGTASDIDTTYSLTQLSGNWTNCVDTNSAISKYWYAIGTAPGATDITNWTDNGTSTAVTKTGLSLVVNQLYYFSIRSENGAGLLSAITVTDGQRVVALTTGIEENGNTVLLVYPNPFSEEATISYELQTPAEVEISLVDVLGKRIMISEKQMQSSGNHSTSINRSSLYIAKGIYTLIMRVNQAEKNYKLIIN
ncbi:MAG: N-acetylmuramyl-L-alanine amidase, negative regulator of AmpC, AmpD [Bacteroidetes bacterium]|jgi:spore germination protein YaaH|nr:N-acetylmuramyl-L-alanine amidase, negative regulator of AmpC, AmpD [Bacteroidota bacterium]